MWNEISPWNEELSSSWGVKCFMLKLATFTFKNKKCVFKMMVFFSFAEASSNKKTMVNIWVDGIVVCLFSVSLCCFGNEKAHEFVEEFRKIWCQRYGICGGMLLRWWIKSNAMIFKRELFKRRFLREFDIDMCGALRNAYNV